MKFKKPKRSTLGMHFLGLGSVITTVHFGLGSAWSGGAFLGVSLVVVGLIFCPKPNFKDLLSKEKLGFAIPISLILLSVLLGILVHRQPQTDAFYLSYLVLSALICICGMAFRTEALVWTILLAFVNLVPVIVGSFTYLGDSGYGLTGNSGLVGTLLGLAVLVGLLWLPGRWKWGVLLLLVGVYFAGDHWTWIGLGVVGLTALISGKLGSLHPRLIIAGVILVVVVGLGVLIGWPKDFYNIRNIGATLRGTPDTSISSKILTLSDRTTTDLEALKSTVPLGHGVQLDTTHAELNRYGGLVHNVPLMILDDLGPIAALAWVFLVGRSYTQSGKYRPLILYIFITSLFSYWFWWPLGLGFFTWLLIGMAEPSLAVIRSSRLQKKGKTYVG